MRIWPLGRYQLDRNSHFVGGRSTASAEALFGAISIGRLDLAKDLFQGVTHPDLFFHEIFNVFESGVRDSGFTAKLRR